MDDIGEAKEGLAGKCGAAERNHGEGKNKMSTIISQAEFDLIRKKWTKPSKYRSKITVVDNIKFRSKHEAEVYVALKVEKEDGKIAYFLRQVPFDLPGNTRYFVDFQVFYKDNSVQYWDAKGYRTKEFIRNKKQVEALYPVTIIEV